MSDRSSIEWTESTWNPVTGCDKVSPGCAHCYAETFAERWRGTPGHPYEQGFDLKLWPERLGLPLRWRRPRLVFVNSMSDLFHEGVPDDFIAAVFATMAVAQRHTFQVLTKRPARARELLADPSWMWTASKFAPSWPLPNVWLGVSIENRRYVGRADVLRATPAAVRFISAEPLLGPLVFDSDMGMARDRDWPGADDDENCGVPEHLRGDCYEPAWLDGADLPELDLTGIDWLIVGGESGPGHRRADPEWVRDLRDACADTTTAFFFKQWGGSRPKANGRELDSRTWDEMPAMVLERVA